MEKTWIIVGSAAMLLIVAIVASFASERKKTDETDNPSVVAEATQTEGETGQPQEPQEQPLHEQQKSQEQAVANPDKTDARNTPNSDEKKTQQVGGTQAKSVMDVKGTIGITTRVSNEYLLKDGPGTVFLEVNMVAEESKQTTRPSLAVAVVIDRSGSMAGRKLTDAKAAAVYLVESMVLGDRVAIISYGTDVKTVLELTDITPENRDRIIGAINRIQDSGNTNLEGGLLAGREQLKVSLLPDGVNRVLLLSDGLANIGITDANGLSRISENIVRDGISITTMGVGADYNEEIMSTVAKMGGGNYYFIGGDLQGIFAQEYSTMVNTVAMETNLELELPPGVTLVEVFGYPHRVHQNKVIIPMHSFYAKQNKSVLIQLGVPAERVGETDVARLRVAYHDVDTNKAVTHESAMVTILCTDNRELIMTARNSGVEERVEEIKIAQSYEEAMSLYEQGRTDEAIRVVQAQIESTEQNNLFLQSPRLDNEIDELNTLERDIKTIKPNTKKGKVKSKKARSRALEQKSRKGYEEVEQTVQPYDMIY